jgi:predicted aspartyl protease
MIDTWPERKNWSEYVGRFSVEFDVVNYEDVVRAKDGRLAEAQIRRVRLSGIVDTGASRLVLPPDAVAVLGLPEQEKVDVRFADGRLEQRTVVTAAQVEMLGRSGVFSAIVEPGRTDALIGAIVLEELDLIPDCKRHVLIPRSPHGVLAEID